MKKKFIIVLFITIAGSLSLSAQSRKKPRTTRKRTTQTAKPAPAAIDTAAQTAATALPANKQIDTIRSVPDSDDGYMKSVVITKARPFPIFEPSPNNVKYYHQYKRDIMLKDPKNAKFNIPGSTLIDALLQGIKDGVITPYDATAIPVKNPNGDAFTIPMNYNQLMAKLTDTVMVSKSDKDGNQLAPVKQVNDFSPDKIVGYRLKEDVYYDKQRAKVETRIVGIAPLYDLKLSNGESVGIQPACWLKYKQCRVVFAKMDVSDADRNLYDVSMDDMFLQRQFNAVIVEESNPKGDRIKDYVKDPDDQLKEAARIEKKLADYKKNMWNYQTSITAVSVPDKAEKAGKQKKTKAAPTPAKTDTTTGTPVKP